MNLVSSPSVLALTLTTRENKHTQEEQVEPQFTFYWRHIKLCDMSEVLTRTHCTLEAIDLIFNIDLILKFFLCVKVKVKRLWKSAEIVCFFKLKSKQTKMYINIYIICKKPKFFPDWWIRKFLLAKYSPSLVFVENVREQKNSEHLWESPYLFDYALLF